MSQRVNELLRGRGRLETKEGNMRREKVYGGIEDN